MTPRWKISRTNSSRPAPSRDEAAASWSGRATLRPLPAAPAAPPVTPQRTAPLAYTPPYLAEKILTSRSALEGERKQVTVLFADLKGSMELLADRDPEEARQLLDPVLERMMAAVHRYEGTVNQVMGDGIMALFGAPMAHEDHAVRACYAALAMQDAVRSTPPRCAGPTASRADPRRAELRRGGGAGHRQRPAHGLLGDGADHAPGGPHGAAGHAGQHPADAATLRLAEGLVQVNALGPVPVKGLRGRWRSLSWWGPVPCGGAYRPRRRGG